MGSSVVVLAGVVFFVDDNLRADEPTSTPTSAEIVDLTADGETLVYTDSLTGRLGFVAARPARRRRARRAGRA